MNDQFWIDTGAGPPLVFLHGGFLDHRMWEDQIPVFAEHYRVIAPDARGHGRSGNATGPFRHTDDLAALLRRLDTGPAILVGLSMGGGIAIDTALEHPGLVAAVIVSGVGTSEPYFEEPWAQEAFAAMGAAMAAGDPEGAIEAHLRFAAEFGPADLLFNNAGVMLSGPTSELRTDDWQRMIDLNVTGLMNVVGAFVPQLERAAAERGVADLVNTSSVAATGVFPSFAVYCGTKAYVSHLSDNLRADLGPKGVRVAVVEPGFVRTELQGHVDDAPSREWLEATFATMEVLEAADVAETVAFLVSRPPRVNFRRLTVMPTAQA
jgi:NADP-dependent 3-hydroxy acid dehydrogenase YdfG